MKYVNKIVIKKVVTTLLVVMISLTFVSGEAKAESISISESTEHTMEIINRIDYWKEHPEECPFEEISKAHAMALVADAVCPDGASRECLSAVMTCVRNRVYANGFPNTFEGVANQPYQWQGLTADSYPDNDITKLARELLQEWDSGEIYELIIPRSCVYMCLDKNGIWFRSEWNGEDEVFVEYF